MHLPHDMQTSFLVLSLLREEWGGKRKRRAGSLPLSAVLLKTQQGVHYDLQRSESFSKNSMRRCRIRVSPLCFWVSSLPRNSRADLTVVTVLPIVTKGDALGLRTPVSSSLHVPLRINNPSISLKLSSYEETSRKQRWLQFGETSDPITGEKLKQIQKEIQEQETLLQGYQQVWQ